MILGIIATILFIAFVTWWDGSFIDMVKDLRNQSKITPPSWQSGTIGPLVEPAPDAFPLRYRSPYVTQNRGTRGTPSSPFFSEPPQFSFGLDMSEIMELHKMGVLSQREARNAWDEASRRMSVESPQGEHEGLMVMECDVEY